MGWHTARQGWMDFQPDPREQEQQERADDRDVLCEACGRLVSAAGQDVCPACGDEPAA